jgi:hypothetical protein
MRRRLLRALPVLIVALAVATGLTPTVGAPAPVVESRSLALTSALSGHRVGPGWTTTVATGLPTQLVAFEWDGDPGGIVEVRAVHPDGRRGPWVEADGGPDDGPDPGSAEHNGRLAVGPVWLGAEGAGRVEVRVAEGTLLRLRLHAIRSEETGRQLLGADGAGAAVGRPAIIGRAQWGADESWRTCRPSYGSVRHAVVHHTAGSNNYAPHQSAAIVRAIYHYHARILGWCDVGYNFLVDRYGQVFEGRAGGISRAVIGAHAGGFNSASTGVSVIGEFGAVDLPDAAYRSLRRLLGWKLAYHDVAPDGHVTVTSHGSSRYRTGTQVRLATVNGHRDHSATACPGNRVYGLLPRLRADVRRDISEVHHRFLFGAPTDVPLACDWNGDGRDSPAVFRHGQFHIRNSPTTGPPDRVVLFGGPGDIPVCGDWNGNGTDTVGVVRGSLWLLRDRNTSGAAQRTFVFGDGLGHPVTGDWNGDGRDTPGSVGAGIWALRNRSDTGFAHHTFPYGENGDRPLVGRWEGRRGDRPGLVRLGTWYLRNSMTPGHADTRFRLGDATDHPLAGDWNGDGTDTFGVFRNGEWILQN